MKKKMFAYAVVSLLVAAGTISIFSMDSRGAIENEADVSVIEPVCKSKPIQRAYNETFVTTVYNDGPSDIYDTIEVKWYVDGVHVDTDQRGTLSEGDTWEADGYIPWPDDYQGHTVCAKVELPSGYSDPDTSDNEVCTGERALNYYAKINNGLRNHGRGSTPLLSVYTVLLMRLPFNFWA